MKKALCLFNSALLLFSLTACTTGSSEELNTVPDEETTVVEDSKAVFAPKTDVTQLNERKDVNKVVRTQKNGEDFSNKTVNAKHSAIVKSTNKVTLQKSKKNIEEKAQGSATKPEASKAINKMPSSKAEIIEYYNSANTKVRKSAKSITHTYKKTSLYKDIVKTGNLSAVAKLLIKAFVKEETEHPTYTERSDIIAMFPAGRTEESNITQEAVAKAVCTDKGSYYEIYLEASCTEDAPDVNPSSGTGVAGRFFTVLLPSEVTDAAGDLAKLEGVKFSYVGGYVKADIEKSTGNMIRLSLNMPVILSIASATAGPLKVEDAKIGLDFNESWSVAW